MALLKTCSFVVRSSCITWVTKKKWKMNRKKQKKKEKKKKRQTKKQQRPQLTTATTNLLVGRHIATTQETDGRKKNEPTRGSPSSERGREGRKGERQTANEPLCFAELGCDVAQPHVDPNDGEQLAVDAAASLAPPDFIVFLDQGSPSCFKK